MVRRHAVPNALLPLVTLSAIQFGAVVGGAITIETIFSWPGLGLLSFDAINDKDFPVLQGTFLVFSAGVILANLARRLPLLLPRPEGAVEVTEVHDDVAAAAAPVVAPRPSAPAAERSVRDLFLHTWRGRLGLGVVALFVLMAIFGSAIAPYDPNASSLARAQGTRAQTTRWGRPSSAPTCSPSSWSGRRSRSSSASRRR